MGQMDGLAEASAVHLRVEYDQCKREQGEESLECHCGHSGGLSPYAGDQCCSDDGFRECECRSERLCREPEELQVQKVHVFAHYESGTCRIHELEDASDEEDQSCCEAAEALQA